MMGVLLIAGVVVESVHTIEPDVDGGGDRGVGGGAAQLVGNLLKERVAMLNRYRCGGCLDQLQLPIT
jgi:hypothetical protein